MKIYFLLILLVLFLLIENPINVQARCIVGESFCMPQTPIILDLSNHQINNTVKVGQQIQIVGYLTNNQYTNKTFAYIVQIQDANGVTMSLSWLTGNLGSYQSLNPIQSWQPTTSGTYTVQIFLWSNLNNPSALQPPESTSIQVI